MPRSSVKYTFDAAGNPNQRFTITMGYLSVNDLAVYHNDVPLVYNTDWTLFDDTTVEISASMTDQDPVKIVRRTSITSRFVDFTGTGVITEEDLDNSNLQWFYALQEARDLLERPNVRTITEGYTVTDDDDIIIVDASGGAITVGLPPAFSNEDMKITIVRKDGTVANAVTIDADGSETINGATPRSLSTQYAAVTLICDGTEWFVIGEAS